MNCECGREASDVSREARIVSVRLEAGKFKRVRE